MIGLIVAQVLVGNASALGDHCQCPACGSIRDCDELWLVSTRHMQSDCRATNFEVSRFDGGTWQPHDADDLYHRINDDDQHQNMVFVHGNRTDLQWARCRGLWIYRQIITSSENAPPVRYVIWAWPSDRQYLLLRDFRYKAQLADQQGRLLGSFVERLEPASDLSFVAYSFGARLVLGGLQSAESAVGKIRVALVAPATHRDWIFPGGRHQRAYERIQTMLLVTNRRDPAMRNYGALEIRAHPAALGEFGVNRIGFLSRNGGKVEQFDVSGSIGRKHDIDRYFGSPSVIRNVRQATLDGGQ